MGNLLSQILFKNPLTFGNVIAEIKSVQFFETQCRFKLDTITKVPTFQEGNKQVREVCRTYLSKSAYSMSSRMSRQRFSSGKCSAVICTVIQCNKKLSYRKQIARKLCIQYVEGIYCNYVTLKSRLEVIQGHRNWFLRLCSCP